MSTWNSDDSRRYWTAMLATPGALIIDGNLYFVGDEPTPADLAANPKLYGCYGTGFTIGHADGTQTITHNLGCCGAIPDDIRPADNAAFIGEPVTTPIPKIATHDHFGHLDYIGGHYPFECVLCGLRFTEDEVPDDIAGYILLGLTGGDIS
jgi:hypothetical protein